MIVRARIAGPVGLALGCLAFLGVAMGCRAAAQPTVSDVLSPCQGGDGPSDALCGRHDVFEDRAAGSGRRLSLKIVVWPALSADPKPDPIFFLAGGPGQGAAALARQVRELFGRLQADRDIVLVDQRGTGDSNPLDCKVDDDRIAALNEPDAVGLERLKQCLAGYDADPRFYTTTSAMDDLDEVRAWLGYEKVNVYGGSYGTRAALVSLRQHGGHVRTMVLDGVAPPDMRLPLYFPRDGQRALDRLLTDCAADPACAAKYPDLARRVRALFARLDENPPTVRLVHPRTGVPEVVRVDATLVANLVFGALYSPLMSSMVPELLVRAEQDDFQGLLALAMVGSQDSDAGISVGMQLSVICSEDAPRIAAGDTEEASAGSLFARRLLTAASKACEFWPRGEVPADYYLPVQSDVPTLVLSGDVDPVTPPSWGELVTSQLTNATHLTAPFTGHGVMTTGCGQQIVRQFITNGSADGLDTACLATLRRPPFFVTAAGPDPAPPSDRPR
jgi:pimeloyl-ACP methyl ester carboxylesterase